MIVQKRNMFGICSLFVLFSIYVGQPVLSQDRFFHLPFDDTTDPGKDISGNGYHGVLKNGAKLVTDGYSGGSVEFDGIGAHVEVIVDVPERNFTIGLWIKTNATDVGVFSVLDGVAGLGGHDRHFFLSEGKIRFRTWEADGWVGNRYLSDGSWHHIALVVQDSVGQTAYVDGIKVGTNSYDHSDFDWQKRVWIGFSNDAKNNYFKGYIDDVTYTSVPLTATQINLQLMSRDQVVESTKIFTIGEEKTVLEGVYPILDGNVENVIGFLNQGDGLAEKTMSNVFGAAEALKVTTTDSDNQSFRTSVPGWEDFKIVENPKSEDEFRYITFAWKKDGGEGIQLQLSSTQSWGQRYHAGKNVKNWTPSIQVSSEIPKDWKIHTRDLFRDWGEFRLRGIAFSASDGQAGYWDQVILHKTITLVGPPEPETRIFSRDLVKGLNLISLPLQPSQPMTAASLISQVGATMVVRLDEGHQTFVPYLPGISNDFAIQGAAGYIVNLKQSKQVTFTGTAWDNTATAPSSSISPIWAFVLGGEIDVSLSAQQVTLVNPRTGLTYTAEVLGQSYSLAIADLNRRSVVEVGDRLEIRLGSDRLYYRIQPGDLDRASARVDLKPIDFLPDQTRVLQNYPNPFNPETWIPFQLDQDSLVTLEVFDQSGKRVRTLDLGLMEAGKYLQPNRAIYWDGRSQLGERVSSGVYFYRLRTDRQTRTRKMVILK